MNKSLKKELIEAGASPKEVSGLMQVASSLSLLKPSRKKSSSWSFQALLKPISLGATSLVIGMLIIIFSQSLLPSSWLYPVQRASDNVAIAIKPSYRENIMMKRAQQVNELVASHASTKQILSTLHQYTTLASAYMKSSHVNYAAYTYCRDNLTEAAGSAPTDVKQPILNSISFLDNI